MLKQFIRWALFLLVIGWSEAGFGQSGRLVVQYLNVGQADAILVTCPDTRHHLLIDSGNTHYPGSQQAFRTQLLKALPPPANRLTVVVASHPHEDHIGNMLWLLTNFAVDTYVDNGQKADSSSFGRLEKARRKLVKSGKLNYVNGKQNSFSKIDFCPSVQTEIFEPWAEQSLSGTNNRSVAVRLNYLKKSFLFLGDLEAQAEKVMLNGFSGPQREQVDADALKVGHHGSDTSSTSPLVNAVSPEIAVLSCGKKEVGTNVRYKHPRLSTIRTYGDWFKNHSTKGVPPNDTIWVYDSTKKNWIQETRPAGLWLTPKDGTITIRSDGVTIEVEKEAQ